MLLTPAARPFIVKALLEEGAKGPAIWLSFKLVGHFVPFRVIIQDLRLPRRSRSPSASPASPRLPDLFTSNVY